MLRGQGDGEESDVNEDVVTRNELGIDRAEQRHVREPSRRVVRPAVEAADEVAPEEEVEALLAHRLRVDLGRVVVERPRRRHR